MFKRASSITTIKFKLGDEKSMSIFKTENCPICGTPTSAMSKSSAKVNGLFVCQDCAKKLASNGISLFKLKQYPVDDLKKIVGASLKSEEEHQQEVNSFNPTKKIGNFIYFDDENNFDYEKGRKLELQPSVICGNVGLRKGIDYSVSYKNNDNGFLHAADMDIILSAQGLSCK